MTPAARRAALLPILPDREGETAIYGRSGEPVWTRAEFRSRVQAWAQRLAAPAPALILMLCGNTPAALAALYGAITAGHATALLDPASPANAVRLADLFEAEFLISPGDLDLPGGRTREDFGGQALWSMAPGASSPVFADLAVMLSTSGTTGSQKFVRLSAANLVANADQIAAALAMSPTDVGVAHLPVHYSYGLSVVTSHLRIGAAVHMWDDSVTVPEFWESVGRSGATQFPGVPFHYNFLARGDLAKLVPPRLKTFTQAGGPLPPRLQTRMHQAAEGIGARFYVMYGQTEAAPRMTTLPHDRLLEKLGSVGPALPGGRLMVVDDDGRAAPADTPGRVIYEGPNVMLGYAESRADLCLGDQNGGALETGDLGRLDVDGYLTLTGRSKRFAKLHGLRLSLEEVEARFSAAGEVAAVERGDKILLFTDAADAVTPLVPLVAAEYKVMPANFGVRPVEALPRKASGKIDYQALESIT